MKKWIVLLAAAAAVLMMSACANLNVDQEKLQEMLQNVDQEKLQEIVGKLTENIDISGILQQYMDSQFPTKEETIPEEAVTDPEKMHFHTIREVQEAEEERGQVGHNDKYIVYVTECDDTIYRFVVESSKEISEEIEALDFHDDDYMEKVYATFNDLPIVSEENLLLYAMDEEEMEALVGKTGQELLDAGFESPGYNEDENGQWVGMDFGVLSYRFIMNEDLGDSEVWEAIFKKATVKSVEMDGISGWATDLSVTRGGK